MGDGDACPPGWTNITDFNRFGQACETSGTLTLTKPYSLCNGDSNTELDWGPLVFAIYILYGVLLPVAIVALVAMAKRFPSTLSGKKGSFCIDLMPRAILTGILASAFVVVSLAPSPRHLCTASVV